MAVPDTNTFSLQDVVNEVNPTTDDLVDCIADAISSKYDTDYYSYPAESLYEFRNYGAAAATVTMTLIMSNNIGTSSNALYATINGVSYYANNNGYYYNSQISVPASTGISYSVYANDSSGYYLDTSLSMSDNGSFYDSTYGFYATLNGTYTTGTSNFTLYIDAYT